VIKPPQRNASDIIDIRLERIEQFFHSLDPHTQWHRQIAAPIEEFILAEARELPRRALIRIRLFVASPEADATRRQDVAHALRAHFAYRARVENANLHDLLWRGVISLAVGLLVLAVCLRIGPWIGNFTKETTGNFVDTAFQIVGWAANWRPVEIFLYDWWPVAEDRRLYRRLAGARVELLPMSEADATPSAEGPTSKVPGAVRISAA
jgi:hypothetical protein